MKKASEMTQAEKTAFKRRPDVQVEYQQFFEYFRMLRPEIDGIYNGQASTEDYYCYLRGALGFDHPSMRDPRAPPLPLIRQYLLEEINIICKKPRVMSVNGHLVVPQVIPNLNGNSSDNMNINSDNNGYLTNAMMHMTGHGGFKKKRRTMKNKRKLRRTRRNNRR
jgi:hypothetical protein